MAEITIFYEGPIVTRAEAKARGLKRYFTGKPCPRGHIAEKRVGNYNCLQCEYDTCKAKREADPEAHAEYQRNWRDKNPDKTSKIYSDYHSRHHERRLAEMVEYRNDHREYWVRWSREQYETNLDYKLKVLLRTRLYAALKRHIKTRRRGGSFVRDLGCSIEFLRGYLEAKFEPGWTWDNHGDVWEIDHKRPLATFNLTDRAEFLQAAHYTNLQPLLKIDNRRKASRY